VIVGNYLCEDVAGARSQIEAIGLVVGMIAPPPPGSDDTWIVLDQSPQPGEPAAPGSAVDLLVETADSPCSP
jgi:beta-lactam-binding protein with PASTA domain